MAGHEPPTPELLDPTIDSGHRAYRIAIKREKPKAFRLRAPLDVLDVDVRWAARYYISISITLSAFLIVVNNILTALI
jgi:hypothetical protein